MSDLIYRQAEIDAVMKKPAWHNSDGSYYHSDDIRDALEGLPSAQPATNCSEIPNGSDDTISRQMAIDALARVAREKFNLSDEFNHYLAGLIDGENAIRQLPSAQPELIEKAAYIRGFEQGRTQGMIDHKVGRNE